MKNSVILIVPVFGGRISNQKDIARHFGLNQVVDDGESFKHWRDVPQKDCLIVSKSITRHLRISGIKVIYGHQIHDEIVISQ